MKACLACIVVLFLSACATTDSASIAKRSNVSDPRAYGDYRDDVDWQYVQKVERLAAHRGVDVKWINYPQAKRKP